MKLKKCFSELKIYYQLLSLNDSTFDEYVETIKSIEIIFSDKLSKDYKVHELTLMVNDLQIDIKEIKSDILEFIQLGKLKKIRKEKTKANKEILFALDKKEGLGLSQKFLRKLRRYRAISDLSALKYFLDENNGVKNDELFKDIDVLKLQRNINYYLSNKDCLILNEAQSISDSFISNVSAFCKQTFVSGKVLRYCEVTSVQRKFLND